MTGRNELIIKFSTRPGTVDENIASVKAQVEEWLQAFNDLENMTDDQIPELKNRLADLRKGKTLIEDERKRIKGDYLKPLNEFESKVKTITEQIDNCIVTGKRRLDEYQQIQDKKKKDEIEAWWAAHTPLKIITVDKVWDDRFLNKTGDGAKWEKVLSAKVESINADLKLVAAEIAQDSQRGNFISSAYIRTLDYGKAVAEWNAHIAEEERLQAELAKREEFKQAQEAAERKAHEEAEKRAQEAIQRKAEEESTKIQNQPQVAKEPANEERYYTLTFRMVDQPEEKVRSLNNTLRALGIRIVVMENVVTTQDGKVIKRIVKDQNGNVIESYVKGE